MKVISLIILISFLFIGCKESILIPSKGISIEDFKICHDQCTAQFSSKYKLEHDLNQDCVTMCTSTLKLMCKGK